MLMAMLAFCWHHNSYCGFWPLRVMTIAFQFVCIIRFEMVIYNGFALNEWKLKRKNNKFLYSFSIFLSSSSVCLSLLVCAIFILKFFQFIHHHHQHHQHYRSIIWQCPDINVLAHAYACFFLFVCLFALCICVYFAKMYNKKSAKNKLTNSANDTSFTSTRMNRDRKIYPYQMVYSIVLMHFNANNFIYWKVAFFILLHSLSHSIAIMNDQEPSYISFYWMQWLQYKKTVPTIFANEFRVFLLEECVLSFRIEQNNSMNFFQLFQ